MLSIILAIENDDDRELVSSLYLKCEERLCKIARGVLNTKYHDEDCVHDAFKGAIEHLEKFRTLDEDKQIKYLIISCRNAAINNYNKKEKHHSITVDGDFYEETEELEIEDSSAETSEIVINEEMKAIVRKYVNSLEEKYRDVIILKFEYLFKSKEIADALFITEDLARQRLNRGKKLLKKVGGKELYGLFRE